MSKIIIDFRSNNCIEYLMSIVWLFNLILINPCYYLSKISPKIIHFLHLYRQIISHFCLPLPIPCKFNCNSHEPYSPKGSDCQVIRLYSTQKSHFPHFDYLWRYIYFHHRFVLFDISINLWFVNFCATQVRQFYLRISTWEYL